MTLNRQSITRIIFGQRYSINKRTIYQELRVSMRPSPRLPSQTTGCCALPGVITALLLALSPGSLPAASCQVVAQLVSLEGRIDIKRTDTESWYPATREQQFCPGDRLRTHPNSRAAIRMINDTLLRLDQNTTITFSRIDKHQRSLLDLLKGAAHFISRVPRSLEIITPHLNAALEGTELAVTVREESSAIAVYEGMVIAYNRSGRVQLTANQTAEAVAGQAPVRKIVARPRNAVAWSLYYPPLPAQRDKADQFARKTIDAIANNDISLATRLADQAVTANPGSAAAFMAKSYVDQANFNIAAALKHSRKAASLAPKDPIVQARLAEVLLMNGSRTEARNVAQKAVRVDPECAYLQAVLGFSSLHELNLHAAKMAFEYAARLNSSAPLPRLGLGLVYTRLGNLQAGRENLENAVLLDPGSPLLRSYLGKAYYEENRGKLASEQFIQAKALDPNDPTPWFYNAILLQTANKPVLALKEIREAIARNDHRAIYRSRQLLDEDNASRNISQARIFSDLGFEELAVVEASRSVGRDPSNHAAHRLLADIFSTRPRHEFARTSELLQSQLLQPLGLTPAQPRLAETNLNILPGLVPLETGYNEFNPLFDRNQTLFTLSAIGGTQNSLGNELTISGMRNRMGYSVGQFHYETDGSRDNNFARYDIYNVFVQITPAINSSLQTEIRRSTSRTGDLLQQFNSDSISPEKSSRTETDALRVGYRLKTAPNADLLVSAIYSDKVIRQTDASKSIFPDGATLIADENLVNRSDIYQLETQYIRQLETIRLITGAGLYRSEGRDNIYRRDTLALPNGETVQKDPVTETPDTSTEYGNIYLYMNIDLSGTVSLTGGLAIDSARFDTGRGRFETEQISPKLGLEWGVTENTDFRFALFRNLTRGNAARQTLEPTNVYGFNQLFDDQPGSDAQRIALAVDHELTKNMFTGIEISKREIEQPFSRVENGALENRWIPVEEYNHRAYLYWTPGSRISIGGEFHYEQLEKEFDPGYANRTHPNKTVTESIPLFIRYYHPGGWFAKLTATRVNQEVEFPTIKGGTDADDERFWLLDASAGYRLPKRSGIVTLEARNLLGEEFRFQETNLFGKPRRPRFAPEQSLFLRFTLNHH